MIFLQIFPINNEIGFPVSNIFDIRHYLGQGQFI